MSQKKKHTNTWNITIFYTSKEGEKKKKTLVRDKLEIEYADMRIIKWLQQFHHKSYVTSCYWWLKHVNIESKLELAIAYYKRFIVKIL